MNCTKRITLTAYRVRYADLREPKPRTIREEVYTIDREQAAALTLLGLDVADMIATRYERGGYHVAAVERITPRRVVALDLSQLWESATDEAGANLHAVGNLEVNDNG